jgi:nucleotide-binding universal stress UspA family protein
MYERILVPLDDSQTAAWGLNRAIALAKLAHAQLRLFHVAESLPFAVRSPVVAAYSEDLISQLRKGGEELLENARAKVQAEGIVVDTVLRDGSAGRIHSLVVEEAKGWKADLIVIGTHGRRGASRLFIGSDAEQVARTAPVPVMLVRDQAGSPALSMFERILVPVDGSPASNQGLDEAVELAFVSHGLLRLIHVVDIVSLLTVETSVDLIGPARESGAGVLERARKVVEAAGLQAETRFAENTEGRIADLVVADAAQWGASIIVLGTHGRRGVRRMFLGSDAEQVVRQASVPVLLVRDKTALQAD